MEPPAAHCKEEVELLNLLKEVQQILSDALNSLHGKVPPTREADYLCYKAGYVSIAAGGYMLLREKGYVDAAKLLIRPMLEAVLFSTAAVKQKGFYFRKLFTELKEQGKLRGNTPQVKAQVANEANALAASLLKNDPTYPIMKAEVSAFDAAQAAGMEDLYQIAYRLYCQYTHGSTSAARGKLDGLTDPNDTFFAIWCVWQMLSHLPKHTPVTIPSLTSLEEKVNRANKNMLSAFGYPSEPAGTFQRSGRGSLNAHRSNQSMKMLIRALVLAVFGFNCWFAWAMLALMRDIRNAGRVLPYFTNLCISLRPLLVVLPVVAAAYCLWLWFQKGENASQWRGFIVATMTVLVLFVFPAMVTSYWLVIEPVRMATATR